MTDPKPILNALSELQRAELLARLDQAIDRSAGPNACHPFTGGSLVRGYGVLWTRQADGRRRQVKAHRLVYEAATGEAPPTIDHRCHDAHECPGGEGCPHRLCCNVAHLTGETLADNTRRNRLAVFRDRCGRGHVASPENIYESEKGDRTCRKCAAENAREAWIRARAERPVRERKRSYRPRGMSLEQLVEWGTEGNEGDGCWAWRDALLGSSGYVNISFDGRPRPAHLLVYRVLVGPIPDGHVVDHRCHVPAECAGGANCPHRQCVNPAHLLAVLHGHNTSAERSSRKRLDECKYGHEFTPENVYVSKRGTRACRECGRRRMREQRAKTARPDARFRAGGVCANGHDTAVTGVRPDGRCAECRREANRRYKERQR